MRKYLLNIALLCAGSVAAVADNMPITPAEIDRLSERALEVFHTPGMSVGILKDGELVFAKGYGFADVANKEPVTPDTVFGIGSQSKAYTSAALAILMDQGKLAWDDKVIDHIPEFRLYDPYVTREFTIRDLLTHRSGLDLGAGDLLMFPNANSTVDDVIAGLQYHKPVSSFRSKFDYDNTLYIVAGEIVKRVSGLSWADFVEKRIMKPLGMKNCRAVPENLTSEMRVAKPYIGKDGEFMPAVVQKSEPMAAAGAIHCSLVDHAKWIAMQLNEGKAPDGTPIVSVARHSEMWTPVTLQTPSSLTKSKYNSHFQAYSLGWRVADFKGELSVSHGGGLVGMVTHASMLPEQNMAVIVNSNSMNVGPILSLTYEILDAYLGTNSGDWVETFDQFYQSRYAAAAEVLAAAEKSKPENGTPALPIHAYVGTYRDNWYGAVFVRRLKTGELEFDMSRSEALTGPLQHYKDNTFIARWQDRTLDADAYVRFSTDFEGNINGITMKPVSPLTDFSFDFKHLDLKRVKVQ